MIADALARRVRLAGLVSYRHGNALSLPFPPSSFDGAYMLHVGMNIAKKSALFAEIGRVLTPGGIFGIYDVMREADGELASPVPWAANSEISFVESALTYRHLLESVGFVVEKRAVAEISRSTFF